MSTAGGHGCLASPPLPSSSKLESHFLDTNAYALLLAGDPAAADVRLRTRLTSGAHIEAVISELTSLEIHSVLGQLARGRSSGLHTCDRNVETIGGIISCSNRWHQPSKSPLRPRELDRLRKSVRDAESGHGPIRLTVIPLTVADITRARGYLYSYATTFRFGSHDAMIAASVAGYAGGGARLVTSDKGLKGLLRSIRRCYFDPLTDELWNP